MYRHTITDLSNGKKYEFTGPRDCPEASRKFMSLEHVEWETEKVEVCPTCGKRIEE